MWNKILVLSILIPSMLATCITGPGLSGCNPETDVEEYSDGSVSGIQQTMGSSGTISQVIVALRNPTSGPYREVTEKGTSMSMILSVNSASSTSTIDYNGPGIYSFPFNAAYSSGDVVMWILQDYYELGIETSGKCAGHSVFAGKRNPATYVYSFEVHCPAGTSGDPHFFGFQGQKYDVMGQSYEIYNIISAPYLQINSRFTPYFKTATQSEPTGTMMGEISFQFNGNKFLINSNTTEAKINAQIVSMKSDWTLTFDSIVLSNKVNGRMYEVTITTEDIEITFIRKVYMIAGLDAQWHFDYVAHTIRPNTEFHGLLGQTWEEKNFENKVGAFRFLDGNEDDYRIKSNNMFGTDFTFNKYNNM